LNKPKHAFLQIQTNSEFLAFVKTQLKFGKMCVEVVEYIEVIQEQFHEHLEVFMNAIFTAGW
jgi:hypothetical protein